MSAKCQKLFNNPCKRLHFFVCEISITEFFTVRLPKSFTRLVFKNLIDGPGQFFSQPTTIFLVCAVKLRIIYRTLICLHGTSQHVISSLLLLVQTFRCTRFHIPSILQGLLKFHKRTPKGGLPASVRSPVCSLPRSTQSAFLVHVELIVSTIVSFQGCRGGKDSSRT